jgi:hypothetical protein
MNLPAINIHDKAHHKKQARNDEIIKSAKQGVQGVSWLNCWLGGQLCRDEQRCA